MGATGARRAASEPQVQAARVEAADTVSTTGPRSGRVLRRLEGVSGVRGERPPVRREREDQPFQFFKAIVETVVKHRLQDPSLDDHARNILSANVRASPDFHDRRVDGWKSLNPLGQFSQKERVELPSHRPISVDLPHLSWTKLRTMLLP